MAGESGCGKSTIGLGLLRLLPKGTQIRGQVMLDGKDVLAMTPTELGAVRWTEGSIVFQGAQHALDPVIRVGDQIVEAIVTHGMPTGKAPRRGPPNCWSGSGCRRGAPTTSPEFSGGRSSA